MAVKALSFGAVLWDIIDGKEHIGGAPFNVSAHMAKHGCKSSIITRVGNDKRGSAAIDEITRLGVDTTFVQVDQRHSTGTAEVVLTGLGVPTFKLPDNVAYDFIEVNEQILKKLNEHNFDVICFGTIEQRSEVTKKSLYQLLDHLKAKHIFYDVNIRLNFYPEEIVKKSMSYCTIIKLSEGELKLISELLNGKALSEEEFVKAISSQYSIDTVCITKGKEGCTVYKEGRSISYPEYVVEVVDTVGAGDAFSAAFLSSYCSTGDAFESARLGNIMGAYVASKHGAIPSYSEEIKKIMKIV